LDIKAIQATLVKNWQADLSDQQACLMDATCYESFVRFPTDAKLLWECCEWVYTTMFKICKCAKIAKPRSKYKEKQKDYSAYSRRRKKGYKRTKKIKAILDVWHNQERLHSTLGCKTPKEKELEYNDMHQCKTG
jgi:hypothetical protein